MNQNWLRSQLVWADKKRTIVASIYLYFIGSVKQSCRNISVYHPGKRLGNMPKRTFWQRLRYFTNEFTVLSLLNASLVISFFFLKILYRENSTLYFISKQLYSLMSVLLFICMFYCIALFDSILPNSRFKISSTKTFTHWWMRTCQTQMLELAVVGILEITHLW